MNVHNLSRFDVAVYRSSNQDLRDRSETECRVHFETRGKFERRLFGPVASTSERFSMRWLRGHGIEIGAGSTPLPLFGAADVRFADVDPSLKYGGSGVDEVFALDEPALFARMAAGTYDFAAASHVLEHVDSLLLGVRNLIDLVRPGGIVYVAVPSREFDHDATWLPMFEFEHHVAELADPLRYARLHDEIVVAAYRRHQSGRWATDAFHDEAFFTALEAGRLSPGSRFGHHKHSYDYEGWMRLFVRALDHLDGPARLVDSAFGCERMDCHFAFERVNRQ